MDEVAALKQALLRCKEQFIYYAASHSAKPRTADTLAKAEANISMVNMIDDVLSMNFPIPSNPSPL